MSTLLDDAQLDSLWNTLYWQMEHGERRKAMQVLKGIQNNAMDHAAEIAFKHCSSCHGAILEESKKLLE